MKVKDCTSKQFGSTYGLGDDVVFRKDETRMHGIIVSVIFTVSKVAYKICAHSIASCPVFQIDSEYIIGKTME